MNATMNLILAAAAAMALAAAGAVLDGPSDDETARAVSADMADARKAAHREAVLRQRCHDMRGPRAELVMISGTDDYACRLPEGGAL